MKKVLFLIFLLCFCIYPQVHPLIPDFRINDRESNPSAFNHENPDIIYSDSLRFTVRWNDNREGQYKIFIQEYNREGHKTGVNFSIPANNIYYNSAGYKLVLEDEYGDYIVDPTTNVYAHLYSPEGNEIFNGQILYRWISECGTGYIEGNKKVSATDNAFYVKSCEGGNSLVKIGTDGSVSYLQQDEGDYTIKNTIANIPGEGLFCAWIKGAEYTSEIGLYGIIYGKNDSVKGTPFFITRLYNNPTQWGYEGDYDFEAFAVNDTTYRLLWYGRQTQYLYFTDVSTEGKIIKNVDSLSMKTNAAHANMRVTNISNGEYAVYVRTAEDPAEMYIVRFDLSGKITEDVTSADNLKISSGLFYTGNNRYYYLLNESGGIYLNEYKYFSTGNKQKVNDDETGSNEMNYRIIPCGVNSVAAIWVSNNHTYMRIIKEDGSMGDVKADIPNKDIEFFNEQRSVCPWYKYDDYGTLVCGYVIYDENFNAIDSSVIYSGSALTSGPSLNIISENEFILVYGEGTIAHMYKIASDGTILKTAEHNFNLPVNVSVKSDKSGFWLIYRDLGVKYSNELEIQVPEIKFSQPPTEYIGNNRFMNLSYRVGPIQGITEVYGTIVNEKLDTVKNDIFLKYNRADLPGTNLYRINNNRFLSLNRYGTEYYLRSYNTNGIACADTFRISTNPTKALTAFQMVENNNKLYITWSDCKEGDQGYNIYGEVFNIKDVTAVQQMDNSLPASYGLLQNYPNPFNPVTNIQYSVAEPGLVVLKIYDILGREAATLVNEYKAAGRYNMEFNASGFASGAYIYRLTVNGYSEVRKMILLK
jgi:hypothetical protein